LAVDRAENAFHESILSDCAELGWRALPADLAGVCAGRGAVRSSWFRADACAGESAPSRASALQGVWASRTTVQRQWGAQAESRTARGAVPRHAGRHRYARIAGKERRRRVTFHGRCPDGI